MYLMPCRGCKNYYPQIEFCNNKRSFDQHSRCRKCNVKAELKSTKNARNRKRRDEDVEYRLRRRRIELKYLLKQVSSSLEEYDRVLVIQNNKCAICGIDSEINSHGRLYVDHDHKTHRFRGLLCKNCNSGLGHFRDDLILLQKAMEYLKCPTAGVTR